MLYHLLYPLRDDFGIFNVFRYITFRTGAATLTRLALSEREASFRSKRSNASGYCLVMRLNPHNAHASAGLICTGG